MGLLGAGHHTALAATYGLAAAEPDGQSSRCRDDLTNGVGHLCTFSEKCCIHELRCKVVSG